MGFKACNITIKHLFESFLYINHFEDPQCGEGSIETDF